MEGDGGGFPMKNEKGHGRMRLINVNSKVKEEGRQDMDFRWWSCVMYCYAGRDTVVGICGSQLGVTGDGVRDGRKYYANLLCLAHDCNDGIRLFLDEVHLPCLRI